MEHTVLDPGTPGHRDGSFVRNLKTLILRTSKNVVRSLKFIFFASATPSSLNKITPLNTIEQQVTTMEKRSTHKEESPSPKRELPSMDLDTFSSSAISQNGFNTSNDVIFKNIPPENMPASIIRIKPLQEVTLLDEISISSAYEFISPFSRIESILQLKTNKRCLVLDLDETLIHSSFNVPTVRVDFILKLNLSSSEHQLSMTDVIYVSKRPGLDEFLEKVSQHFEVIIFTASLPSYANPIIDQIDPNGKYIHHRLFRHSCIFMRGHFIKDLAIFGQPLHDIIIVDNSPVSYMLQPQNAIAIPTWTSDPHDRCLFLLCPELIKASVAETSISILPEINTILQKEAMERGIVFQSPFAFQGNFAAILDMISPIPLPSSQEVEKFC